MSAKRVLTVFCTELAALAGRHRYRTKDEAIAQFLSHNENIVFADFPHLRELVRTIRVEQAVSKREEFQCRKRNFEILDTTIDDINKAETPEEGRLILEETLAVVNDPAERDILKSIVFKTRGIRTESKVLGEYERITGCTLDVHTNAFRTSAVFTTPSGIPYRIGGRLDGICDSVGRIVEVKSRMNKFFLPEYDILQIYGYFAITGLLECDLIQSLYGDYRTETICYDEVYWQSVKESLELALDTLLVAPDPETEKQ